MITLKQFIIENNMERFSHVLSYLSKRIQGHNHDDSLGEAGPHANAVQKYADLDKESLQKEHDSLTHRFHFIMDINDLFD